MLHSADSNPSERPSLTQHPRDLSHFQIPCSQPQQISSQLVTQPPDVIHQRRLQNRGEMPPHHVSDQEQQSDEIRSPILPLPHASLDLFARLLGQ